MLLINISVCRTCVLATKNQMKLLEKRERLNVPDQRRDSCLRLSQPMCSLHNVAVKDCSAHMDWPFWVLSAPLSAPQVT